jgi:hypothetical protein
VKRPVHRMSMRAVIMRVQSHGSPQEEGICAALYPSVEFPSMRKGPPLACPGVLCHGVAGGYTSSPPGCLVLELPSTTPGNSLLAAEAEALRALALRI